MASLPSLPAQQMNTDTRDDELLARRVVRLNGDFTTYSTTQAISKLLFLHSENSSAAIHLILESGGGDAIGGFAVIDAMNQITCSVYTFAPSHAHAIAAIVFANGEPAFRFLTASSQLSFVTCEFDEPKEQALKLENALIQQIIQITGNEHGTITADHRSNRKFDPRSAIEYNLADQIVDSYPYVNPYPLNAG